MVKIEMKLLAPVPLCAIALLAAGIGWFVLRNNRPHRAPTTETGPRLPAVDRSVRERFLAAAADTNRTRRSARFAPIFRQLTAETAAELAAEFWAREKTSPFQNDWYDFLRRWTELDPAGALAFAETHAAGLLEDWLFVILPAWGTVDREAALGWWSGFVGPGRERIAAAIIGAWAHHDWQGAAKWIETKTAGIDQTNLALALAVGAAAADASGAQAKVDARLASGGAPTAVETALFLRVAAQKLKFKEPGTLAWIASVRNTFPISLSIRGTCEQYLVAGIESPAVSNEERGEWLTWLTEPTSHAERSGPAANREEMMYGMGFGTDLFSKWLAVDAEAASAWLGRQQGRPCYDQLAAALALAIAEESPDMAATWAGTVGSLSIRITTWMRLRAHGLEVPPDIADAIKQQRTEERLILDRLRSIERSPRPLE